MISQLLSRYMIEKITTQPMPFMLPRKCINELQKKQSCQTCATLCPHEAIELSQKPVIKKESCQGCGICSSVCPTGTWVQPLEVVQKQYHAIAKDHDVVISCQLEEESTDLVVECLATLPWEFFAYITLDKKLTLLTSHCESCSKKELCLHLNQTLKQLEIFLGTELYREKVEVLKTKYSVSRPTYSRRELLMLWTEESKKMMTEVVPLKFEANQNARIYRSLLVQKLNKMNSKTRESMRLTWGAKQVNAACYGCGICEVICPQKAIEMVDDECSNQTFRHHFTRCTDCGLCETVCLENALSQTLIKSGLEVAYVDSSMSVHQCLVCQDPIPLSEGDICVICQREELS